MVGDGSQNDLSRCLLWETISGHRKRVKLLNIYAVAKVSTVKKATRPLGTKQLFSFCVVL